MTSIWCKTPRLGQNIFLRLKKCLLSNHLLRMQNVVKTEGKNQYPCK